MLISLEGVEFGHNSNREEFLTTTGANPPANTHFIISPTGERIELRPTTSLNDLETGRIINIDRALVTWNQARGAVQVINAHVEVLPIPPYTFAYGDGSPSNPFVIQSLQGLMKVSENMAAHYRLATNLDAGPLGNNVMIGGTANGTPQFTGSFNGGGYTIIVDINFNNSNGTGLIRNIGTTGTVSNLNIEGSVRGTSMVGALAGVSSGTIEGVNSTANVVGNSFAGGLVGSNAVGGTITNSGVSTHVDGGSTGAIGGLAGWNTGTISHSHSHGTIRGIDTTGGLVGQNQGTGVISNSYSTMDISRFGSIGGPTLGGLVGTNSGSIENSHAGGHITSTTNGQIGGLVGQNAATGNINNSYSTGNLTAGVVTTGGFVGSNMGLISGSYTSGNITNSGTNTAGSFAGSNIVNGRITNSHSTGMVNGRMAGLTAFVGTNTNSGGLSNSFGISMGLQYGTLNEGTPAYASFTLNTNPGASGHPLTLNSNTDGIYITPGATSGSTTVVVVNITNTPREGVHMLSLSLGGTTTPFGNLTTEDFPLTIEEKIENGNGDENGGNDNGGNDNGGNDNGGNDNGGNDKGRNDNGGNGKGDHGNRG